MDRDSFDHPVDITALLWLRSTLFVTLFISAFGALVSFRCILIYSGTVTGYFELAEGTPEHSVFQIIQRNPGPRLALEGFCLALWLGVLLGATYLLRFREWARVLIKVLITIELFITLGIAFWPAITRWLFQKTTQTDISVDLLITTLEAIIVVVLSHPRVMSLTYVRRGRDEEMQRLARVRDHWPDKMS